MYWINTSRRYESPKEEEPESPEERKQAEEFGDEMSREWAAELKLINGDPRAAELHDANEIAKKKHEYLLGQLAKLSDNRETFLSHVRDKIPGQREAQDNKLREMQEQVAKAEEESLSAFHEWAVYKDQHQAAFSVPKGEGDQEYHGAWRMEHERQEKLAELRRGILGSKEE